MTEVVAEMASRYADAGFALPSTWKGRMEAVIAGAIDFDDVEDLIAECAAVADRAVIAGREERQRRAKAKGCMDMTPLWSAFIPRVAQQSGGKPLPENVLPLLLNMAEVADAVEAGEIEGA